MAGEVTQSRRVAGEMTQSRRVAGEMTQPRGLRPQARVEQQETQQNGGQSECDFFVEECDVGEGQVLDSQSEIRRQAGDDVGAREKPKKTLVDKMRNRRNERLPLGHAGCLGKDKLKCKNTVRKHGHARERPLGRRRDR
jgi:hypothetical protein